MDLPLRPLESFGPGGDGDGGVDGPGVGVWYPGASGAVGGGGGARGVDGPAVGVWYWSSAVSGVGGGGETGVDRSAVGTRSPAASGADDSPSFP